MDDSISITNEFFSPTADKFLYYDDITPFIWTLINTYPHEFIKKYFFITEISVLKNIFMGHSIDVNIPLELVRSIHYYGGNTVTVNSEILLLIASIEEQRNDLVDFLLKLGASSNLEWNNIFPLELACKYSDKNIVYNLLTSDSNINLLYKSIL